MRRVFLVIVILLVIMIDKAIYDYDYDYDHDHDYEMRRFSADDSVGTAAVHCLTLYR